MVGDSAKAIHKFSAEGVAIDAIKRFEAKAKASVKAAKAKGSKSKQKAKEAKAKAGRGSRVSR